MARQDAQVLYSALTFRVLLDTLARPGTIKQLARPDFQHATPFFQAEDSETMNSFALGALLTLLDRETSFVLASHAHWLEADAALMQWIMLRSGSHGVAAEQAAFALFCDEPSQALLTQLQRGTLLEPEMSATAIFCVAYLTQDVKADTEDGRMLELRGPGIADVQRVYVRGISEPGLDALVATRRGYPLGIDAYLVDAAGRCLGLPRTTRITWSEKTVHLTVDVLEASDL